MLLPQQCAWIGVWRSQIHGLARVLCYLHTPKTPTFVLLFYTFSYFIPTFPKILVLLLSYFSAQGCQKACSMYSHPTSSPGSSWPPWQLPTLEKFWKLTRENLSCLRGARVCRLIESNPSPSHCLVVFVVQWLRPVSDGVLFMCRT
jgi:hypothetical protein